MYTVASLSSNRQLRNIYFNFYGLLPYRQLLTLIAEPSSAITFKYTFKQYHQGDTL